MIVRLLAVHPALMVSDVSNALIFYAKPGFSLGFQDSVDKPMYAGIRRDEVELHLQWHDSAQWEFPNDRPIYRFLVQEVDALSAEFDKIDILDRTKVKNTEWGTREFHMRDPDGSGLQFYRNL